MDWMRYNRMIFRLLDMIDHYNIFDDEELWLKGLEELKTEYPEFIEDIIENVRRKVRKK